MKKTIIRYFLFLLFFLSFFSSGVIDSQDGLQYLAVARNIYYKGEPTAPPYEYDKGKNIHMSTYVGKDGKTYSSTGLGYSLAMVPAVAITDIVYKMYGVSPPVHFPLENDWLIFLAASFTNAVFAAILGVVMFVYFNLLGLSKKQSLFMSLITLFTTNLFVLSKHSFAHMMFITFLMLSFLFIKLHFVAKKNIYLMLSGLAYGVVMITYNMTFLLTAPVFVIYYFLAQKEIKRTLDFVKKTFRNGFLILLGALPFITIFVWFETLRQFPEHIKYGSALITPQLETAVEISNLPAGIFIEGIYGQLFSPGRSFFLYSPLLLVIIFFWHKIKKVVYPELFSFILLALLYIPFYSTQYSFGGPEQGYTGYWAGESSWGPRYLGVLIPFGTLVVGNIYKSLSKRPKLFIFLPLVLFGIYVEILGVLMPYQIKFYKLDPRFFVNKTEYNVFSYGNLLFRYSPIFTRSDGLFKSIRNFKRTVSRGPYNVRFYDGIDFPFDVGPERWRTIEGTGYISFDNYSKDPVRTISAGIINHPLNKKASDSVSLRFFLNSKEILNQPVKIALTERKEIDASMKSDYLKKENNNLIITTHFDNERAIKQKLNLIGLIWFAINGKIVNFETLDAPYVYSFGLQMVGAKYQNWGGANKNPWRLWDIHTQIYERTPDFWWIKPLYYWDLPKNLYVVLFIINVFGIGLFGYLVFKKTED